MARKSRDKQVEVIGLLGVGLDNQDGHKRVTHGDDFVLVGGSQETHERMQDVTMRVTESLQERGKRLCEAEPREVLDLLQKALDR